MRGAELVRWEDFRVSVPATVRKAALMATTFRTRSYRRTTRTTAAAAAAALLLLAAGCGDDGDSGGSSSSASSDSPAPSDTASGSSSGGGGRTLSRAQTQNALLTVQDFPSGWKAADLDDNQAGGGDSPDDLETDEPRCDKLFDIMDGDADTNDAVHDASREFEKGAKGPFVSNPVSAYSGNNARRALKDFKQAGNDCGTFHSKDGRSTITFKVSPMTMQSYGDASVAFRAKGTAKGGNADGRTYDLVLVLARVASSTTGVALMSVDGTDNKAVPAVMKNAVKRLQQVTDGKTPSPVSSPPSEDGGDEGGDDGGDGDSGDD